MTATEVNYPDNVAIVSSEQELLTRPFTRQKNVVVLSRTLPNGFLEMAGAVREFAQQKFKQDKLPHSVYVSGKNSREYGSDVSCKITWRTFDNLFRSCLSPPFKQAVEHIQEDRKLYRKPQLRMHWNVDAINIAAHPDYSADLEYGRMLACYAPPTTKGWHPSQQKPITHDTVDFIKSGQESDFFQFRVGDIWRHACKYKTPGYLAELPAIPFVHKATRPENEMPRILMIEN